VKTTRSTSISSPDSLQRRIAAVTALVLTSGLRADDATAAQGAGEPVQLPDIEVQAQRNRAVSSPKFTAPLVDTPQVIAVIPENLFNQQGAQNLTDVLRNTPGITFNAGENGFVSGMSNFSLRGFDTTGNVFVDGARDSGNYMRDVFNIEQVEIAKGPASDNGRSGAGGYVNLATKSARLENFQHATLSHGFDEDASIERNRAALDVNQQVGAGTAVRVNALWQEGGVAGRDYAERNTWGFAPSVAFGLDGATRVILSYQHLEQNDVPDWGVPGALIPGVIGYNASARDEANRSRFYGHVTDYDDVTSDSALARVEHDLSPTLRLSNQTRWSQTDRAALYTVPTGYTAATRVATTQRQAYSRENTALSNLTNLAASFATGVFEHAFSTGLEFTREEAVAGRYPANGVLGNPGSTPIDAPDPSRPLTGFVGLVPSQTSAVEINTVALYAYDTVQLNPQWQVTGGLRVETYEVAIDSNTAAGAPQGPDAYDRDDTTVSGKVGLVYKPAANGSIYAAVGVAALPPASFLSNPDISREGDNAFPGWSAGQNSATSKVQRSINYELGTKWNFLNSRFTTTAALFRTERENVAMAGTVNGVANTFAGYGQQIVQGLELGATGQVTREWAFFGGVLFMDSERRHSAAVDAARLAANPGDYGTRTSTNGDELAFSPKVSATLWTTYRLPFGLTVGGGAQQVGDSYLGRPDDAERIIANGNAGELPGYTVFNAVLSYDVSRQLTLRLNIDNLTDEFYAASSNWNGSRVALGAARSFLLSAELKF
jgi:catecholate siderophore receptor